MKNSDDTMLWLCVATVFIVGTFVIGFGLGVCHGREEYKNELHKQVKENNALLKENIALIEKQKGVGKCRPGWREVNVSKETIEKALKALKKAIGLAEGENK